jgi:hypothetical protein
MDFFNDYPEKTIMAQELWFFFRAGPEKGLQSRNFNYNWRLNQKNNYKISHTENSERYPPKNLQKHFSNHRRKESSEGEA